MEGIEKGWVILSHKRAQQAQLDAIKASLAQPSKSSHGGTGNVRWDDQDSGDETDSAPQWKRNNRYKGNRNNWNNNNRGGYDNSGNNWNNRRPPDLPHKRDAEYTDQWVK